MALAARPIVSHIQSDKPVVQKDEPSARPIPSIPVQKARLINTTAITAESGKIMLQPRVCTLRSYGSDRFGVMKMRDIDGDDDNEVSRFFEMLSEYIESSKKSQDFEIISGRLAMIIFAGTVTMEIVTGNSLFRKTDLQGIEEGAGACLAAIGFAASFAWFSSARTRVGRVFSVRCNTFIDSLIDQVVDGMFYETDLNDWIDDI
ncbi:stress enhanced protein 2, chloroplastic-like [Bidens hawaiensis]|uniref:stress enhanced protein 2, chloroplastic-like n=1 Tax=Bidens hawaiensis TaxID=980011 RepID=UPI00404953A9